MKYTKIANDTFSKLQLGAGLLLVNFDPETGTVTDEDIFGATDGGVNFTATPTFRDNAEGIDNAPLNMKELKVLDNWEVTLTGTLKTLDTASAQKLIGAGDVAGDKITARTVLKAEDFSDVWWVGDYGDKDGFLAIRLTNALNTGGFSIQSADKDKGAFAFTFTGHGSIENQDVVPFELYVKGTSV